MDIACIYLFQCILVFFLYYILLDVHGKFIYFFLFNCIDAHCVLWITACALFILHSLTYSSYQNCWPIVYYIWRHRACPTKFADKSFFCKPMQFILGHVLLKLLTNLFFCKPMQFVLGHVLLKSLTNLFFLQTYAIKPIPRLYKKAPHTFDFILTCASVE